MPVAKLLISFSIRIRALQSTGETTITMTKTESGISLYDRNFIPKDEADNLLTGLLRLPWKRHTMKMYGKEISMPRMYQWMGIAPTIYGERIVPIKWTPETLEVQRRIQVATGFLFNSLNINLYRGENDHIGWHSDGEEEGLWEFPIAS